MIVAITEHSQAALMMVFKTLMIAIVMQGRDLRIPDTVNAKIQCHKAAIKVRF
jgi:hypothetical protein